MNIDIFIAFLYGALGLQDNGVLYLVSRMYDYDAAVRVVQSGTMAGISSVILCCIGVVLSV